MICHSERAARVRGPQQAWFWLAGVMVFAAREESLHSFAAQQHASPRRSRSHRHNNSHSTNKLSSRASGASREPALSEAEGDLVFSLSHSARPPAQESHIRNLR